MHIFVAALLAATIGGEVPLSKDQIGPAPYAQFEPRVAASPHGSLVVWRDQRVHQFTMAPEVYGARLDREGRVLDPLGIRIFPPGSIELQVVWTGTDYLVAGHDRERIDVRRVSVDGKLGETLTLFQDATNLSLEGIESDGITMLVLTQAWKDGKPGRRTATLFEASGKRRKTRLGKGRRTRDIQQQEAFEPLLAIARTAGPLRMDGSRVDAQLDSFEGRHVLVWSGGSGSPRFEDVYALDSVRREPVLVSQSGRSQNAIAMAIASDGSRVFAAALEEQNSRRIVAGVAPLDEDATVLNHGFIGWPGVAWLGDRYIVTWTEWDGAPDQKLMARLFDANGKPLGDAIVIDRQVTGSEEAPSVATDGSAVMIAWPCLMRVAIFSLDRELRLLGKTWAHAGGTPVASLLATVPPPVRGVSSPKIAWDGTSWITAWVDAHGVHLARVTEDMRVEEKPQLASDAYQLALSARYAAWSDAKCVYSRKLGWSETQTIDCDGAQLLGLTGDLLAWRNARGELVAKRLPDGEPLVLAPSVEWGALAETKDGITAAYVRVSEESGGVRRAFLRQIRRE